MIDAMLRYELTSNNAGFVLWGDSEALDELNHSHNITNKHASKMEKNYNASL
ncbi:hypothetical protein GQ718_001111 [Salmonella enterica]|nr:hypothetical protein [Salmonella enterica]EDQ7103775.1 hypothetical protein [Salmonella enterica subsp. houtenae serovar 48:g,z51:-]EDR3674724.1 hypothetical protein [Salmonella enterica subsp. arizonae serovar 40:z4,z24:]EDT2394275.1 hypothetical protein [Salmonella enterica subsp. arizonae]EDX0816783.1 hypothetical protein [Salmonella enterica subsp. enterica]